MTQCLEVFIKNHPFLSLFLVFVYVIVTTYPWIRLSMSVPMEIELRNKRIGQLHEYVITVNWFLLVVVVWLVIFWGILQITTEKYIGIG